MSDLRRITSIDFNVNDKVWVRLTDHGWRAHAMSDITGRNTDWLDDPRLCDVCGEDVRWWLKVTNGRDIGHLRCVLPGASWWDVLLMRGTTAAEQCDDTCTGNELGHGPPTEGACCWGHRRGLRCILAECGDGATEQREGDAS